MRPRCGTARCSSTRPCCWPATPGRTGCGASRSGARWSLHLALLGWPASGCPIGLAVDGAADGQRVVLFVPALLLVSVGPVILAVSAQAPLMQQLVRRRAGGQPLPAVRRLEPRQLRRPARLPAGGRAHVAARRRSVGAGPSATASCSSSSRVRRAGGPARRPAPRPARSRAGLRPAAPTARRIADVARLSAVPSGPHAVDHDAPEHRHHGDAAAVGHPARASTCSASRSRSPTVAGRPASSPGSPRLLLMLLGATALLSTRAAPDYPAAALSAAHAVRRRRGAALAPLRLPARRSTT